jgi:hypothetical protein
LREEGFGQAARVGFGVVSEVEKGIEVRRGIFEVSSCEDGPIGQAKVIKEKKPNPMERRRVMRLTIYCCHYLCDFGYLGGGATFYRICQSSQATTLDFSPIHHHSTVA